MRNVRTVDLCQPSPPFVNKLAARSTLAASKRVSLVAAQADDQKQSADEDKPNQQREQRDKKLGRTAVDHQQRGARAHQHKEPDLKGGASEPRIHGELTPQRDVRRLHVARYDVTGRVAAVRESKSGGTLTSHKPGSNSGQRG